MLSCLLKDPFPGRDQILSQIGSCKVKEIDFNGSLQFNIFVDETVDSEKRIPVEGEAEDIDAVIIHFLLHVINGKLVELEIYRDDSAHIIRKPKPEEIRVLHLG
ncbi:MAG: hypothetical protein HY277_00060 [Ignavibacteriales bacterium]|nr:hypothetical protein [Ignavibacteriales bacterium]